MNPLNPTQTAPSIALLEDDVVLRERVLLPGLKDFGFVVSGHETAAALYAHLQDQPADIVILDVGLPDQDGFSVARQLREIYPLLGIVMLTGRGKTPDRVRGLSEGADAYLSKPVEIELLAATLHSLARRLRGNGERTKVHLGWRLDADGWCLLSPSGAVVALTKSERSLFACLSASPGKLVTREALIAALTSNVFDFDNHRLDSMIHRLRRKVADACGEPLPLSAVHGEGYVLTATR